MDKWQALYDFFSQFLPAYEENSVPDDAPYPRITYEARTGGFDDIVPITASVWDKGTSWENVDSVVNSMETAVNNYECPEIDGGRYRVYRGEPFAQRMKDPESDLIRRTRLQINFEFLTV